MIAPFPYYGGKRRWADEIWSRFGKPDVYAEPFAGSLAVLLANPNPAPREIVCDTDGGICNFWRALRADPEQVAHHADYPTIHQDLTARHAWLRRWVAEHSHRLMEDPDYYSAKAAGWWVWGISIWIGGGWCQTGSEKMPAVTKEVRAGQGVSAQRDQVPNMRSGDGVSAQRDKIPHVSGKAFGGKGVSAQRDKRLLPWFEALAERLHGAIVLNRSWESALTPTVLADTPTGPGESVNRCVFLDPPYATENRHGAIYGSDGDGTSDDVAAASWRWALENGDRYRIAYCCHAGDVDVPDDWTAKDQTFRGPNRADTRAKRDQILFSPACLDDAQKGLFE